MKPYTVDVTDEVVADIQSAFEYIHERSPQNAINWLRELYMPSIRSKRCRSGVLVSAKVRHSKRKCETCFFIPTESFSQSTKRRRLSKSMRFATRRRTSYLPNRQSIDTKLPSSVSYFPFIFRPHSLRCAAPWG